MEEFFDILKTKNSLPDGSIPLPDVPPSLAQQLLSAEAAAAPGNGSAMQQHAAVLDAISSSSIDVSSSSDKQTLVEAALLLDQQQHPKYHQQQQQHHNLGSADLYAGSGPDHSVSISGLGLEVELQDVKFGYHPERQVRCCQYSVGTQACLMQRKLVVHQTPDGFKLATDLTSTAAGNKRDFCRCLFGACHFRF